MYRLYIDEVGTDDLLHLSEDSQRYLSLSGLVMKVDHARDTLTPAMNLIKAEIFNHDPDEPLIFHRKDILSRKGPYGRLNDNGVRAKFDQLVGRIIEDAEYVVITALIDKAWMVKQRHWVKSHPYHYLMEIMIEKYVQYLERKQAIGDVMPEARQGKKDLLLQRAYEEIRNQGTRFVTPQQMESALRASHLKFRTKRNNVAGLQLCDLIAHPSHIYVRSLMGHSVQPGAFAQKVIKALCDKKYDRSWAGKILGYGIKHLPQQHKRRGSRLARWIVYHLNTDRRSIGLI